MIEDDRAVVFEVVAGATAFRSHRAPAVAVPKEVDGRGDGASRLWTKPALRPCPLSRRLKEQSGHPNAPVPIVPI